jgi:hypothetical protein
MIGTIIPPVALPRCVDRVEGYLTATASEDWGLVLEVCERASSSEANAKETIKALKREFKSVSNLLSFGRGRPHHAHPQIRGAPGPIIRRSRRLFPTICYTCSI